MVALKLKKKSFKMRGFGVLIATIVLAVVFSIVNRNMLSPYILLITV